MHMYKLASYTYPKILQIETAPVEYRPTYDLVKMPNFEAANSFGRCYHPPLRGKHILLSILISESFIARQKIW
jgi:hypothetical protein